MTIATETYAEELVRATAELHILEEFDLQRAGRGHDYGAGQRTNEIRRLTRDVEEARRSFRNVSRGDQRPEPTKGDLVRAFNRSIVPRVRRALREIAEHQAHEIRPGGSVERRIRRLRLVIDAARATAAALELNVELVTDGAAEVGS